MKKTTIGHGMMIIGITFAAVMCLLFAVQTMLMTRASLYPRYDSHIKDVLTYIEHTTDIEDIRQCMETGVPSEKYNELQQKLNRMVDEFELIYIYISVPTRTDTGKGIMVNVISSTSDAERAAGATDFPIGYSDENYYTEDQLAPYFRAWDHPGEFSEFSNKPGYFESSYIVAKPLLTPEGGTFALLCADMSLENMHRNVNGYTWRSVALIVLICILFSFNIGLWLSKQVVRPLRALEASARGFAEESHGKKDPSTLVFEAPALTSENEIQSLSNAITQMSADMRDYVGGILSAEKRAATAEEEAEDITRIAYEDALTHVRSKVAYEVKKSELAQKIADGSAKFVVVMVDLNNLKRINDTYGLENGDRYIDSSCKIISGVYGDIPVYRIGGDEFLVILEGDAYYKREELFELLEEGFREAQADVSREPWERCSAAAGMTEFSSDADSEVDQVYRRAEKIMLRNKRMMKKDPG